MKACLILIALVFTSIEIASAQSLRELFKRQSSVASASPLAVIEMMERQLSDQFKGEATEVARHSTAKLIQNGQTMAFGTVINARSEEFSYLLCPADAIKSRGFVIQTQDGKLHRPIANVPIQLLSKHDNLAIVRIAKLEGIMSIKSKLVDSQVGSFVGILSKSQSWKTGAVTNSNRTAYTGIDPNTQTALSKHWERIGLKVNAKRSGYPEVIETDLNLDPAEAGSPIFDRNGTWHGIAIARADQHSTLVIPAKRVANLVAEFEISHHR